MIFFSDRSTKQLETIVPPVDKYSHSIDTFSQTVQKSPKLAPPRSPIEKLKHQLWKVGPPKSPPSTSKSDHVYKKKHVNFDKYQIYQLSENIVVSTIPEQDLGPQPTTQDEKTVTFYMDQDHPGNVPTLVDSDLQTVESVTVARPELVPKPLIELPNEEHDDHTHHCLGYEVHPLGSTSSSIVSLGQIAKSQHVGEYKFLSGSHDKDALNVKAGTESSSCDELPSCKEAEDSQDNRCLSATKDSNLKSSPKQGLHKVCTAPATLPCITVMPATPEVFELKQEKLNQAIGLKFALNDNNVYSLPMPDDVVNPSSPTNITPTKLSSSPAKSGIPFSGPTMARRSSESDLSTPPKGT